jgi:hypothetical protein
LQVEAKLGWIELEHLCFRLSSLCIASHHSVSFLMIVVTFPNCPYVRREG